MSATLTISMWNGPSPPPVTSIVITAFWVAVFPSFVTIATFDSNGASLGTGEYFRGVLRVDLDLGLEQPHDGPDGEARVPADRHRLVAP